MLTLQELMTLPLTPLEQYLKGYQKQHPRLQEQIFTPGRLSAFIYQLMTDSEYTLSESERDLYAESLTPHSTNELSLYQFYENARRHSGSATDAAYIYAHQSARNYFPKNYDIAVTRMFRYMPAHWHTNDFFEIYYVLSGDCPLLFENETVVMNPGTVFILSPTAIHASPCYADDRILLAFQIRSETFRQVFWNHISGSSLMATFFWSALSGEIGNPYLHFETGNDEVIQKILYRIYTEYYSDENYRAQMLNALMSEFFILLLRRHEGSVQLPKSETFHWKRGFAEIFQYIQNHYDTVTLKMLSEKFHYSERQLTRIIQKCTGKNFSEVLYELRMKKAGEVLSDPSLTVAQTAEMVGYQNLSAFHRAFTKFYGCTPGAYKKERSVS